MLLIPSLRKETEAGKWNAVNWKRDLDSDFQGYLERPPVPTKQVNRGEKGCKKKKKKTNKYNY